MIRPEEIEQNNSMVEEIVKELQETFFNPSSKKFDKNRLDHTASGKAFSADVWSLLMKKRKEIILRIQQQINEGNFTDSMTIDVIKKYKIKYISSPNI